MSTVSPKNNSWQAGAFLSSEVDEFGLDPYEFRIYLHLCRRVNDENRAWPSHATIATVCRMSEKKVRDVLKSIRDKGLISITNAFRDDGGKTSNNYSIIGVFNPVSRHDVPGGYRHDVPIVSVSRTDRAGVPRTDKGSPVSEGIPEEGTPLPPRTIASESDPFLPRNQKEAQEAEIITNRLRLNPEWEVAARERSEGKQNPQAYFDTLIVNWESGKWQSPTPKKEPSPPMPPPPPLPGVFQGCLGEGVGENTVRIYVGQARQRLIESGVWIPSESLNNPGHCDLLIESAREDYRHSSPNGKNLKPRPALQPIPEEDSL